MINPTDLAKHLRTESSESAKLIKEIETNEETTKPTKHFKDFSVQVAIPQHFRTDSKVGRSVGSDQHRFKVVNDSKSTCVQILMTFSMFSFCKNIDSFGSVQVQGTCEYCIPI